MPKAKKVVLIIAAVILSIAVLVSAFIMIFFTIPAKDYDPDKYQLVTYCDDENCECRMYQGKQYFDYEFGTDGARYQLNVDEKMVDLDTVVSWGYGFPFSAIMSYSSYDENQPDYIVGDWVYLTLFAGDLESELFSMEGVEAEFTLPARNIFPHEKCGIFSCYGND